MFSGLAFYSSAAGMLLRAYSGRLMLGSDMNLMRWCKAHRAITIRVTILESLSNRSPSHTITTTNSFSRIHRYDKS